MRLRLTIYYVKCSDGQPFLITGKEVEHEHKKGISVFDSDTVLKAIENALK